MISARSALTRAGLVVALLGGAWLVGPARAAGADTALKLIPADAAFCSDMLHNREQFDIVAHSKAWAALWGLPSVQQAWTAVQREYNNPTGNLAGLKQLMQVQDNQDLVALLGDAFSDEVFCYGDDGWADLFQLYEQASVAARYQPLLDQLDPNAAGRSADTAQIRAVLSVLAKNPDRIKVPNVVIGFKIPDAQKAEKQIARLEALAKQIVTGFPQLKADAKRVKVGDADFLALTLDSSALPWTQLPLAQYESKPGEFAPAIDRLKKLTLTISFGVEHGYLLVGIGPSTDYLATFGGKGARLAGRPEFKPLSEFADRKLTSIGYASQAYRQAVLAGSAGQLDQTIDLARAALARADLTEAQRKDLLKMLTDLRAGVANVEADAGAEMDFSFLTDRGYEGYGYDYGKHGGVDASKPLTLLNHLGGSPLLAVVGRVKVSPADYEKLARAVEEAFPRLDKIVEDKLSGDDKKRYEKVKEDMLPLVKRLSDTTDKLLLPALADGQYGFVVDAKWTSKQWLKVMPETDKAMPAPEFALVLGVSDAEALQKAMAAYRQIANEALAKIKTWPGGDKIGEFQIPAPKKEETRLGTFYSYPLPEEWGLDPQVRPTAGVSGDAAAVATSHEMAVRLLASHPLKVDGGPLADPTRPLAAAVVFDWAGLVDAATPWVEYGVDKYLEAQAGAAPPADARRAVQSQVRTALDVLKCFRGVTSATYLKDGVLVTHRELVFKDLEK